MKLHTSEKESVVWIVQDGYGETRTDLRGRSYRYEPLPIARIPVGYGRTFAEAVSLAQRMLSLLTADGL